MDSTILSYTPMGSYTDSVQFESEWSFLRPFSGKKKTISASQSVRNTVPSTPPSPSPYRPSSPMGSPSIGATSTSRSFNSLRQTITRPRAPSATTPLSSLFQESTPAIPSPSDLLAFLTSLHTLFVLSDVNPALTTQLWSQVMYWTSCQFKALLLHLISDTFKIGEIFNRVITRKKYICR